MKLLAQVPMILAFDVFDDPECDRKRRSNSPIKTITLTCIIILVEQDIQDILLFVALVFVFGIGTPFAVEIALAEKHTKTIEFAPAIIDIFLSTYLR